MEDSRILELYWAREQSAISETEMRYGKYLKRIAFNILYSEEDAQECVNDTYLKAWESMPPHRPDRLSAFLGKITRNIALDRYDANRAQKRCGGMELALDELGECIPDAQDSDGMCDEIALKDAINGFLRSLPKRTRIIFLRRYFYLCSVCDIAQSLEMSESNVKVTLLRTRQKLKEHLKREGIII